MYLYHCTFVHVYLFRKLPYDVSNDQALEHQEVRDKIRKTIDQLCSFCDRFQKSILESVHKIP